MLTLEGIGGNLDCSDIEDLNQFAKSCAESPELILSDSQIDQTRNVENAVDLLKLYAEGKAHAMGLRLRGEIARAVGVEDTCDYIYGCMPESVRW